MLCTMYCVHSVYYVYCVQCVCTRSHGVSVQTFPAVHSVAVNVVVYIVPVTSILHLLHKTHTVYFSRCCVQVFWTGVLSGVLDWCCVQMWLYLYRRSSWMREILLGVKVKRMNGQQTFIFPHLSEKKKQSNAAAFWFVGFKVTWPGFGLSRYHFVALSIGLSVVVLSTVIHVYRYIMWQNVHMCKLCVLIQTDVNNKEMSVKSDTV